MSALAIEAAKGALVSSTGLSDIAGGGEQKIERKKITPWSFKLLIVGCVVGAVAAVAAFVFQMIPLMVACILLSATNGFAAFHVKKLAVLKTLEGYTFELSERVKTLSAKTLELKEANKDLEKITGGLKKIPKDLREALVNGEKMLTKTNKERDEAIAKFSLIQQEMHQYVQAALEVSMENDYTGRRVEKLQALAENPESEEAMLKAAKRTFKLMKDLFDQEKKKRMELTKQLTELLATVPKAVESTEQVQALRKDFSQMIRDFQVQLNKLKKYRDGYRRWKTWVRSAEYQQYKAWKANK